MDNASGRKTTSRRKQVSDTCHQIYFEASPIKTTTAIASNASCSQTLLAKPPCGLVCIFIDTLPQASSLSPTTFPVFGESIRAFGWIVRDKRLDVISGHRASVDKGSHDEAVILIARPGCQLRMFT